MFMSQEAYDEYQRVMAEEAMSEGEYMAEAMYQHTVAYGEERPDDEYLLSPFDTWEKNPWYAGEPGPHPEDYDAVEHHWKLANEPGYHAYFLFCEHELGEAGVVKRWVDTDDSEVPF